MDINLEDLELFFEPEEVPTSVTEPTDPVEPIDPEKDIVDADEPADEPGVDADEPEPLDVEDEVFKTNFEILKEKGFLHLPEDYEFTPTEEGWNEMLTKSYENLQSLLLNQLLEELPTQGKDLLNFYLEGGRDLNSYIKLATEEDFTGEIDSDDVDFKKRVIEKYYKETTKFSDEKIQRNIKELELENEVDSEFSEAVSFFKDAKESKRQAQIEADKAANLKRKQEAEEAIKTISSTVKSNKEIYGIPFSEKDSTLVINSLFKPIKVDGQETTSFNHKLSQALNDPKKVAVLVKLLETDFDFSPIKRTKVTEATNSVRDKLKTALNVRQAGGGAARSKSDFDIESATPLL